MAIYFLRYSDLIKIGFATNVRKRVMGTISSAPVDISFAGYMPGGRDVEAHLHKVFQEDRAKGEWFLASERLSGLIDLLAQKSLPVREEANESAADGSIEQSKREWREAQTTLRKVALTLWPSDTHGRRQEKMRDILSWAPRRLRSVYEGEKNGRLSGEEFGQVIDLAVAHLGGRPEAPVSGSFSDDDADLDMRDLMEIVASG